MRYTRKFIEARFATAMDAIGAKHGERYTQAEDRSFKANVGVHFIDHAPIYGGYEIRVMHNEGGAESHFAGSCNRMSASEFVAHLNGIIAAASIMKDRS